MPLLFLIYTSLSVGGMVLVKYALPALKASWEQQHQFLNLPGLLVATGAAMYVFSFLTWMVILARAPLSTAYPIAVGLAISMSSLCAVFILKEQLSGVGMLGIALIFAGVVLLTKS
ncbi:DMT family transporter [Lysobacter sp. Hz 25]|uniref:DMT family transporter n=1 Tax=Lysobacter sp. Hz 25 TaxID=3383698 RepID=UPI0038D3C9E7